MTQEFYEFDCGCKFPIVDTKIKSSDGLPSLYIDYQNLNYNCQRTWMLFKNGYTKGIFQLESNFGKNWAKKLEPTSIAELSALIAILRPGCLKYVVDGKSMTQKFVDRKHHLEDYQPFHSLSTPVLAETHDILVYQEQAMEMCKLFAGFTLLQAEELRKSVSKKDSALMNRVKDMFLEGCQKQNIISHEDAVALFDNIEASNRYAFNKSHSNGYAELGYWCAVSKQHFPLHFFTAWLQNNKDKIKPLEEVKELCDEMKNFDIDILTPSLLDLSNTFKIVDKKHIRFGVGDVKGVGVSKIDEFMTCVDKAEIKLNKKIADFSWFEMLIYVLYHLGKTTVNNLIAVGTFSHFGLDRKRMLFDYNKTNVITESMWKTIVQSNVNNLCDALEISKSTKGMQAKKKTEIDSIITTIKSSPTGLKDESFYIASIESDLLGVSITQHKLDSCDTSYSTMDCKDFKLAHEKDKSVISCQIDRISLWTPEESTDTFAFLTCSDKTGTIECMVSPSMYEKYDFLIFKGNTIRINGIKNKKGGINAQQIHQI